MLSISPLDLFLLSCSRAITQDNSKPRLKVCSKLLSAELYCHKIHLLSFNKFNYQSRRHCLLLQAMFVSALKHWVEVEKRQQHLMFRWKSGYLLIHIYVNAQFALMTPSNCNSLINKLKFPLTRINLVRRQEAPQSKQYLILTARVSSQRKNCHKKHLKRKIILTLLISVKIMIFTLKKKI